MGVYGFSGEFRFLSNMWLLEVPLEDEHGIKYYSSENYYVASKTTDIEEKMHIASLPPKKSKVYGRKLKSPVKDWDKIKVKVMNTAVRQKFKNNPDLAQKLIQTGSGHIEETNNWHDQFWGVCNSVGHNMLGLIIMDVRTELMFGSL